MPLLQYNCLQICIQGRFFRYYFHSVKPITRNSFILQQFTIGRCIEANSPGFLVSVIHTHIRPPLAENILASQCTYTPAVCFIGTYTFQNKHIHQSDSFHNNKSSDIADFTAWVQITFYGQSSHRMSFFYTNMSSLFQLYSRTCTCTERLEWTCPNQSKKLDCGNDTSE